MKKPVLKKLLLGSIIALQLNSELNKNTTTDVYAKEALEEDILLDENGKTLQMIAIIIDDYEYITLGYKFVKDNNVYLKDARTGRIYNFTKISEYIKHPLIVYIEIEKVLSKELRTRVSLTQKEATEIIDKFKIMERTLKLPTGIDTYFDIKYLTFTTKENNNQHLLAGNCSLFSNTDNFSNSFTVTDKYNEESEVLSPYANDYILGISENTDSYLTYSNIYQEESIGESNKMGIITCYYVFDKEKNKIATLKTQEQLDDFLIANENALNSYTWKAAYYNGTNIDTILEKIENNIPVSSETTTYFIDYYPPSKSSKKVLKKERK